MQAGPSFSDVLAQPGPSAPAQPQPAGGGVSLNDRAKQAAMSNPIQQARIATAQSLQAVKALGVELAQATDMQRKFETPLRATEEVDFQGWKKQNAPMDSGEDYDLRGAYKQHLSPSANGHWPDTYKKPSHPTFSNESQYYKDAPEKAGRWEGERFIPPGK